MIEEVKFKRSLIKLGDSLAVTLPPELLEFLRVSAPKDKVTLCGLWGKHGRYISIWLNKELEEE